MTKSFQNSNTISGDVNLILNQLDNVYFNTPYVQSQELFYDDYQRVFSNLTPTDKKIYSYIRYNVLKYPHLPITQSAAAMHSGCERETANRSVRKLVALGFLTKKTFYKKPCQYGIPEFFRDFARSQILDILMRPYDRRQTRLSKPIVTLNIISNILITKPQDFRGPIDFSGGNQGYYVDVVLTQKLKKEHVTKCHDTKTINGNEAIPKTKESTMSDNAIRPSILKLRTWLQLTIDDEESISSFDDVILEAASKQMKSTSSGYFSPVKYFITTCSALQKKHDQTKHNVNKKTSYFKNDNKNEIRNPIYQPYFSKQRNTENPLDAAKNIESRRQEIVNNLSKFMSKEQANEIVSRRVAYYLDINEGIEAKPVSSVEQLFHVNEGISPESRERLEKFVVEVEETLRSQSNDSKEVCNPGGSSSLSTTTPFTQQQKTMGSTKTDQINTWHNLSISA